MTPEAIDLVKSSYAGLRATERQLAAGFYERLFGASPNLRRLFPADLTVLQGHFEAALSLVIRNLNDVHGLKEPLRDLGAQHVHWGRARRTTSLPAKRSWDPSAPCPPRGIRPSRVIGARPSPRSSYP